MPFFPLCVCDGKRLNAEATSLKGFLGGLLQNAFDLPQAGVGGGMERRKRRDMWSRCSVSPLKLDTYYMFVSKSVV